MRLTCMRSRSLVVASCVLLLSACGGSGGKSSPTEPSPTPTAPVSLEGSWSGTVTLTTQVTCTLSLTLSNDAGDFLGNWKAQCPDGKKGSGIAAANLLPFNQAVIFGLLGQPVARIFGAFVRVGGHRTMEDRGDAPGVRPDGLRPLLIIRGSGRKAMATSIDQWPTRPGARRPSPGCCAATLSQRERDFFGYLGSNHAVSSIARFGAITASSSAM